MVKHSLKMTAMHAWQYRLSEQEVWDLTAFVKQLPTLSPTQYQRENEAQPPPEVVQVATSPSSENARLGNPKAGRHAMEQYLCPTCHLIPGVVGANGTVGPL